MGNAQIINGQPRSYPQINTTQVKKQNIREFCGDPVVKTQLFNCRDPGSIPGQGLKILQAVWHSQKKKVYNTVKKKKKEVEHQHTPQCLLTLLLHKGIENQWVIYLFIFSGLFQWATPLSHCLLFHFVLLIDLFFNGERMLQV